MRITKQPHIGTKKNMSNPTIDRLDQIAEDVISGDMRRVGVLSTGERLYVALASNRVDLLADYTIAQALMRIGDEWTRELTERWQYRDIPRPQATTR
jgi:methyl coenzyme M reductase beta subunit